MYGINVKGHRKHLEWRVDVLSLRRSQGWSTNRITAELWNFYPPTDITKKGLLSFVKRTIKRGIIQDVARIGRPRTARTMLNIEETRERHQNKQNPGQRATAKKLRIGKTSVQKF
ncbi:unnamed protein product [Rotaria sp. Silwood1]|nr:unnamed protein product [Rotaria sp. Silwood1]